MGTNKHATCLENLIKQYEDGEITDLYFYEHYDKCDVVKLSALHIKCNNILRKTFHRYYEQYNSSNMNNIEDIHSIIRNDIKIENRDKLIEDLLLEK